MQKGHPIRVSGDIAKLSACKCVSLQESREVPSGAKGQPQSASANKADAAAQVNASVLSQVGC